MDISSTDRADRGSLMCTEENNTYLFLVLCLVSLCLHVSSNNTTLTLHHHHPSSYHTSAPSTVDEATEVQVQMRESLPPDTYAVMAASVTATDAPLSQHGAHPAICLINLGSQQTGLDIKNKGEIRYKIRHRKIVILFSCEKAGTNDQYGR